MFLLLNHFLLSQHLVNLSVRLAAQSSHGANFLLRLTPAVLTSQKSTSVLGDFFFFFTFEDIPDIPSQMRKLIMGKKMKGASEITFHKVTLVLKDIIRWEPKNLTLTFPDTFQAFWLKLLHLHHQRDLPLQ